MLYSFRCRLRRVVAFNTGELRSAINAAVLGDVIEMVELNRSKFRLSPQRGRRILRVIHGRDARATQAAVFL